MEQLKKFLGCDKSAMVTSEKVLEHVLFRGTVMSADCFQIEIKKVYVYT